jgi:hypothetical protein
MTNDKFTGKLTRLALIFQEYQFKVIHRPAITHQIADTMSRRPLITSENFSEDRQDFDQIPTHNQNKPSEKYIQVVTIDGHEFWFMGLVNYDKGFKNMQEIVTVTRTGQPVSPATAQASGVK